MSDKQHMINIRDKISPTVNLTVLRGRGTDFMHDEQKSSGYFKSYHNRPNSLFTNVH